MPKGITDKTRIIRGFLLDAIRLRKKDVVADASKAFGISRQSINRHLSTLVEEGWLIASGNTRARIYSLGPKRFQSSSYSLEGLDEHLVYRNDFAFIFEGLPDSVIEICHYGFTEMLNNARDHSEGEYVTVSVIRDEESINIRISDDGEGIFNRIARIMQLSDPRESILELSKGKLTTDPDNHTGEGIFFTSRAFDYYHINSGELCFTHHINISNDVLFHNDTVEDGTTVLMEIAVDSTKDLGKVFDDYSSGPDEYRFERTVVPVRLALYEGETLVSRSQAKRILHRVEKFRTVILDFEDVDKIGQAFADEVFRVFKNNHPDINLIPMNTSEMIERMIVRAQSIK
jgi:anti-sigma regulatory factor (Ser/Thr protein kinase)